MIDRLLLRVLSIVAPEELADEIEGDLREQLSQLKRSRSSVVATIWLARAVIGAALSIGWSRTPFARRGSFISPPLPARRRSLPVTLNDLRFAVRLIAKQPVLSATAVGALGVSMCLAIFGFTMLSSTLWAELPLPQGERYVYMEVTDPETLDEVGVAPEVLERWINESSTLATIGAFEWGQANLEPVDTEPVGIRLVHITPRGMAATQVEPVVGRLFEPRDAVPGAEPVVLLREDLWEQHYRGDPDMLGAPIRLGGSDYTLVGVLPREFAFPSSHNLWLPRAEHGPGVVDGSRPEAFGIMADDADMAEVQAELEVLMQPSDDELRAGPPNALRVVPYTRGLTGGRAAETFMAGVVTVLLLILAVAAANVANLILVRAVARSDEYGIRAALGASRTNLIAQGFGEVLLLGALAAILGTGGASLIFRWLRSVVDNELPMWIDFRIDPVVGGFIAFLAVFSTSIASIGPMLRATRGSLDASLRQGSTAVASGGFGRASASMIVAELALSVALLSTATLLGRGLVGLQQVDLGLDQTRVLTASLYLPPAPGVSEPSPIDTGLLADLESRVNIRKAGLTMRLPKEETRARDLEVDGREGIVRSHVAHSGLYFFDSLEIAALRGRTFTASDHETDAVPVVVVNESFATAHLGTSNPVGQRLRFASEPGAEPTAWREIVGVVRDLGLNAAVPGESDGLYLPVAGSNFYQLTATFEGPFADAARAMRAVVGANDSRIIVREVQTLEQSGWAARTLLSATASGLSALGVMALALSVTGMYAIMAFSVQQRTREFGVRVALGAEPGDLVRRAVLSTCVRLASGAGLGVTRALLLSQAAAVLPIAVPALSMFDVAVVCGTMMLAGLLAAWLPARQAGRVNPADALRAD
ncbi:MAG: FtsX-like permease family protein [Acidobacteria bacterium]|nr:FtsX-like permease family protein [Acidobacteriota bacterium]